MNLQQLSNRNLVYSFREQLTAIKNGVNGGQVLTPTHRATLRKYGIIESAQGQSIRLTEKGRRYLRETMEAVESG